MDNPSRHFKGKSAIEHLKEARKKGEAISAESHGLEPSGFAVAFLDNAKVSACTLFLFWIFLFLYGVSIEKMLPAIFLISFGLILAGFGRSAYLGWARLERLHRLIEEERWEIQHHRMQEKEELIEMYKAKGFSGDILHQIVETLMSDDNRLLEVMLVEELGLPLEAYEHPVKQGFFAALGITATAAIFLLGLAIHPIYGPVIASFIVTGSCSLYFAVLQRNERLRALIWNWSLLVLSSGSVYFLGQWLFKTKN
ncbi:MAG: VIT1/CCC1 transporter family protein [Simkaniaceae bacterium]